MDSSELRDALQKLKDSSQLRANPIIIATVHATRRDSKWELSQFKQLAAFSPQRRLFGLTTMAMPAVAGLRFLMIMDAIRQMPHSQQQAAIDSVCVEFEL